MKKICKIFVDVANNNSAIGTAMYEVDTDADGKEQRRRIPGSERLWADDSSISRNSYLIPSVIVYRDENGQPPVDCYGYDALEVMQKADWTVKPCSDIKYRFFVEGMKHGQNAQDFRNLIGHLLRCVRLAPEDMPDAFELSISHPLICTESDKVFLQEMITDAWLEWFPKPLKKICMVDEGECAFRFALSDIMVAQMIRSLISEKKELHVLLVDIGGSTMELSLHRFTLTGDSIATQRLAIQHADTEAGRGMGSTRVDNLIKSQIMAMGLLDTEKVSMMDRNLLNLKYFTPLKESLNDHLAQGKQARLDLLASICDYQEFERHRLVSAGQFESWCSAYTSEVCNQIRLLCESVSKNVEALDMVLLTGGGCALYPIENAIRKLIHPKGPELAKVLRPLDVSCVIGSLAADPDSVFPEYEAASLACVLGNMAEDPLLNLKQQKVTAEDDHLYVIQQLTNLEERKASARKWMLAYVAANFGLGAAIPPGMDVPFLSGVEVAMGTHVAAIMYKGTGINAKELMSSIVLTLVGPLLGSLVGQEVFKGVTQAVGVALAPVTGGASIPISMAIGGSVAASITLALGHTFLYIIEGMITGKIRRSDLLNKDPELMKHLKQVTKENYKRSKKEAKELKRKKK